ncbi:hypothetical protein CS062_08980 [Roseateles chitinivorans]|uniref:TerB family tellurite resistance protein n=1 Tax=Roseateles chitinivorans TaxID=2917965 RepID=A0A2G9CAZ2_9BURK|nr:hypothetical protein [Roseateles chitinivorans]PIM53598.1 hypothetical protein CS062_08980 [Roseateles chitinivorans]
MSAPAPLLLPPPELKGVDEVVADPLRFKAKLAIGEEAYASLRLINRGREVWDVLGAAGAGAAVAKTGLVASLLGASATPIGWVAFAALASGGACYGMYRLLSSTKGERVIEIPKYLNTPLDTLGLALFDLIAPLSLRLAAVDGTIEAAERQYLVDHLIGDWGLNRAFVEQSVAAVEARLGGSDLAAMAAEGAEFLHLNPDCNHAAIAKDLGVFMRGMLEAGGPLTPAETEALDTVVRLLATAPPGELSKRWNQTMGLAGGAAGQVRTVLVDAADWTQQRLPSADQVRATTATAATTAWDAARKAADWTQQQLPTIDQVRAQAGDAATQAADAARKAALWTQERLPSAEQVRNTTAEAANQAMGVAKKGFAWAKDLTTRAPDAKDADQLPRGDVPPAKR